MFWKAPLHCSDHLGFNKRYLLYFLTKCWRGERFCDGYHTSLLERGVFASVTRRWLALIDAAPREQTI